METWEAKVLAMLLLLAVVLVFGLLPLKLLNVIRGGVKELGSTGSIIIGSSGGVVRRQRGQSIVDGLNCFAGGVFLATAMLHLLPEVREDMEKIMEATHQTSGFPLAEFVTCVGFFVVMVIEHVILAFCSRHDDDDRSSGHGDRMKCFRCCRGPGGSKEPEAQSIFSSAGGGYGSVVTYDNQSKCVDLNAKLDSSSPSDEGAVLEKNNYNNRHNNYQIIATKVDVEQATTSDQTKTGSDPASHKHGVGDVQTLRSLILLLALSTHTIFEGLAVGLQPTAEQVLSLLTAILIHKAIVSFTVGLRFAETLNSVRRTVLFLVALSLMAPVGVAVGLAVTETGSRDLSTDVASAAMQGLATGTFLYVTFFEILFDQMKESGGDMMRVFAIIVGFACITVLNLFTEHSHH